MIILSDKHIPDNRFRTYIIYSPINIKILYLNIFHYLMLRDVLHFKLFMYENLIKSKICSVARQYILHFQNYLYGFFFSLS